jgi:adenosine kinase
MTFGGKFRDSLVVEQLDKLSVSFLVDELEIRRGGVAPNMCYGLGRLGLSPVLVGAAGDDFADYRSWLERHGVDCSSVRISETRHTARFVCTTDTTMAQFASFYPGAMSEARLIELAPIVARVGDPTYVLVGPDDPEGMLRHTQECRSRSYPFIADPGQQLAFGEGDLIRQLVDGASILFSNAASLASFNNGVWKNYKLCVSSAFALRASAPGARRALLPSWSQLATETSWARAFNLVPFPSSSA